MCVPASLWMDKGKRDGTQSGGCFCDMIATMRSFTCLCVIVCYGLRLIVDCEALLVSLLKCMIEHRLVCTRIWWHVFVLIDRGYAVASLVVLLLSVVVVVVVVVLLLLVVVVVVVEVEVFYRQGRQLPRLADP